MNQTPEIVNYSVAVDARGALLPVEFSDVPFTVRRIFVVTGPPGGAIRGQHVVPCEQLLCIISGEATVQLGTDENSLGPELRLTMPGQAVRLNAGTYVVYSLHDEASSLLVLAEEPYSGSRPE